MRLTEKNLDKSLDLALENLRKNLEAPGERNAEIGKTEVLMKTRAALKSGKIDLLVAGNIEQRLNHNLPLEKTHRAVLGLTDSTKIEGLSSPALSSVESRFGGEKTPGRPAAIKTGAPLPQNPIVAEMARGRTLLHSFQQPDGTIMKVTGQEILLRCQQLIQKGEMNLVKAGDLERAINSGVAVRPEILRELFEAH